MTATEERAIPEPVLDEEGRIDEGIECRRCGYDLRGLSLDGRCPECEMPVGRTVHGDLLRFQDPIWLKRLLGGTRLLLILALAFLVIVATDIAMDTVGIIGPTERIIEYAIAAATGAVFVGAVWLITSPEPGRDTGERPDLRVVARTGTVVSVVGGVLLMPVSDENSRLTWGLDLPESVRLALDLTSIGLDMIGLAALAALFVYARRLVLRLPDDQLAGRFRVVGWGLVLSILVLMLNELLFRLTNISHSELGGFLAMGLGSAAFLALVVFFVTTIGMLVAAVRRLKVATAQAARRRSPGAAPPASPGRDRRR